MENSILGKTTVYRDQYDASLLFPIARSLNREKIGVHGALPFVGCDFWNHYEVSWLDGRGKPIAAIAEFDYDCDSPYLIESKSMKLYFNSFNNTKIDHVGQLERMIQQDIGSRIHADLRLRIIPLGQFPEDKIHVGFAGECIDHLAIDVTDYQLNAAYLTTESDAIVSETLSSNLLKSNCLVTGQPDWGSVSIEYRGRKLCREGLLRYIVSYRNMHEFSETGIERIFMDIMCHCAPEELTVYGRFTRRGGLDINPIRSTSIQKTQSVVMSRFCRQ